MLRILFLFNGARNEFRIWNPDYQELGAMYSLYSFPFVIDALTVLVFAFKSLKFFPLQKDLDMLAQTLFQAGGDLSVFVAMMIIILFGFTIMAINIFGTQSENFYLFVKAIGTLFLILLGEFDFEEMKAVDALWATIFFIVFVLFMFFVVLNIFLAILNDAYTVVHTTAVFDELEKKKPLSLREKFELQKSLWRERKTIKAVAKMKKEKVKAAKKKKKEFEKKVKEKGLMGRIGRKKRKAEKKAAEAEAAEGGGGGRKSRAAAMLGRLKPHG